MPIAISNPPKNMPIARAFFVSAANTVLGRSYELSIAFVGPSKMRRLNRRYRGKDRVTDILSFPLSKNSGELIFCLAEVQIQATLFDRIPSHFLKFLFIHGLLHLKGMEHSATMERLEIKFRKRFGI